MQIEKAEGTVVIRTFIAYGELDPQTGLYVGIVSGILGAHT